MPFFETRFFSKIGEIVWASQFRVCPPRCPKLPLEDFAPKPRSPARKLNISVIWFGFHNVRTGLHTFEARLHIVGAGLRIIKTKRAWASRCADQALEIENLAPELGSQASTNDVYLRKAGWPDLVWASTKKA